MTEFVIEAVDPRAREAELKDLFARNGKTDFESVFERYYRPRAEQGMRSWVGSLGDQVVMHISVAPMRFAGRGQAMTAGVLGDLMVDESQRDFWAPVRLLRRMVADVKRAGELDFLLSTTVFEAESVFKAGGFKPLGRMRRYLLPLSPFYLPFARLRGRVGKASAQTGAIQQWETEHLAAAPESAPCWRPQTNAAFYTTRIPRAEFADGNWVSVKNRRGPAGWALLSRNPQASELALADAFWKDGNELGEVVHAAARWARRERFSRLAAATMQESDVAKQLERLGFFARGTAAGVVIQQVGKTAPPTVENWFLPAFAMSSW